MDGQSRVDQRPPMLWDRDPYGSEAKGSSHLVGLDLAISKDFISLLDVIF